MIGPNKDPRNESHELKGLQPNLSEAKPHSSPLLDGRRAHELSQLVAAFLLLRDHAAVRVSNCEAQRCNGLFVLDKERDRDAAEARLRAQDGPWQCVWDKSEEVSIWIADPAEGQHISFGIPLAGGTLSAPQRTVGLQALRADAIVCSRPAMSEDNEIAVRLPNDLVEKLSHDFGHDQGREFADLDMDMLVSCLNNRLHGARLGDRYTKAAPQHNRPYKIPLGKGWENAKTCSSNLLHVQRKDANGRGTDLAVKSAVLREPEHIEVRFPSST
jgi:hypothetical protein